ncbi:MAG TPA: hypothetical protein PK514_04395 [Spirochaetota bacterium]|nr:hypothetical protein [Spirochaetota bacterium]
MVQKIFKGLFITGFIMVCTAVFLDTYKVASLSMLKSSEKKMQFELKEKYTIAAPDAPINEGDYLLAPSVPESDASQEEKDAYEEAKTDFDAKVKDLKAKYDEEKKAYDKTYKEYQRKQKTLDLEKQRNAQATKKFNEKLTKDIEVTQLAINDFVTATILRYIGSLILLLGSLGILLFGETYEKLGVLVVLGFGIKTIIGL